MKTLREIVTWAEEKKIAVGHFNISDSTGFRAVVDTAAELGVPVIVGVSEGERDFIGLEEIVALVKVEKDKGLPIYLNADHSYSFDRVKKAIDAGFDSVIIDGASIALEENVRMTKTCVDYARATNPNVVVEAEIGFIGKSSKILENIPDGVSEATQTKPEEAQDFVERTGIDMLAPSVGNVHGMVTGGEPRLNIARIQEIHKKVKVPLVLHGASGNSDADILAAIDAGIRIVHINTEIRVAYKMGIQKGISTDEVAPYKFLAQGEQEMKMVIKDRLRLFNKKK